MFNKFPKIKQFHNVYKEMFEKDHYPVSFKTKVKIHGTNAAITLFNSEIFFQSRNNNITLNNDNNGFVSWAFNDISFWQNLAKYHNITIFGEWCGPKIMKGTAANLINNRIFAIISIYDFDKEIMVNDPKEIEKYFVDGFFNSIKIIPYHVYDDNTTEISIDFNSYNSVINAEEKINNELEKIQNNDPFFYENFNVTGKCEGLVLTPITNSKEFYKNMAFKAKTDEYKSVTQKKSVQKNPESFENIENFLNNVMTQNRLEQGMIETFGNMNDFDAKQIGYFLKWIGQDIYQECQDELISSGLEWDKNLTKKLNNKAKNWFINGGNFS